MKEVKFNKFLTKVNNILPDGLFLTVKSEQKLNTMTIGWANIGFIWGVPVFTVVVRKSRYTYRLIEKADEFTVSIPFNDKFKKELAFCGSHSGKNIDKFKECNLHIIKGKEVSTPVIKGCNLFYECKIKYKQAMEAKLLNSDIDKIHYADGDYHTFFYGEIVSCYYDEKK